MIEKFKPSMFKLPKFEDKMSYLYYLYNNLGFTNLELCISKKEGDTMFFSKWVMFSSLLEKSGSEWVKGTFNADFEGSRNVLNGEGKGRPYTRDEFIQACSHRTIMDIELMFDVDESGVFPTIKDKSVYIVDSLKRMGFNPHVSFTGNKSYHISVIIPELRGFNKTVRKFIKETVLKNFGADTQKSSERCMISMLGAVHYRSKKPKTEVEL